MNIKCTLEGSGKVVVLRPPKIKDKNVAAEAAAIRSGGKPQLMEAFVQDEMLKLLVVSIDGKDVKPSALEDLDAHFEYDEYQQLMMEVGQLVGVGKRAKVELIAATGNS